MTLEIQDITKALPALGWTPVTDSEWKGRNNEAVSFIERRGEWRMALGIGSVSLNVTCPTLVQCLWQVYRSCDSVRGKERVAEILDAVLR
jgi:hypothetical protein